MTAHSLLAEIYRRDRVLALTGWINLALLMLMLGIAPFDSRSVTGLNPWIKPMKFAASIAVYTWTLAWFMAYLPGPRALLGLVRWGVPAAMIAEILCIASRPDAARRRITTSRPLSMAPCSARWVS